MTTDLFLPHPEPKTSTFVKQKKGTKYMEATIFNPIQQHLLMLFAHDSSEERLLEIKEVLSKHFANKVDEEMDKLWEEGKINNSIIEQWGKKHMRIPYK